MLRRIWLAVLAALLLGGTAGAQEWLRYYPPTSTLTAGGSSFFAGGISLGNTVASPYANLFGDAANTLALRNGGTTGTPVPQTFNVYNFCSGAACATGYERATLVWAGNVFYFGTEGAGTGTLRAMQITASSVNFGLTSGNGLTPASSDILMLGSASSHWQSLYLSRSIQGSKSKTLTDAAAAVSFARIAVATNSSAGGEVIWSAMSTNGTEPLTQVGTTYFAGANTAGTVTCTVGASGTPITAYSRVNTLACTITTATSTTNCDLQVTCTDNLAGDQTPVFSWRLDMPVVNAVVVQ